jgi:hypothetical protein
VSMAYTVMGVVEPHQEEASVWLGRTTRVQNYLFCTCLIEFLYIYIYIYIYVCVCVYVSFFADVCLYPVIFREVTPLRP